MARYCAISALGFIGKACESFREMRAGASEPVCGAGSKPPEAALVKSQGGSLTEKTVAGEAYGEVVETGRQFDSRTSIEKAC